MPIDPLTIGLAEAGVGLLGSLFFTEDEELSPEQRQAYDLLLQRTRGMSPELLAALRRRVMGAVGSEFSGLSMQALNRLRRQGAPIAKQEEVLDKLSVRRAGARSDALTGVDALNEQMKQQAIMALSQFTSGFPTQPATGQAFGDLLGAGLGNVYQSLGQDEYLNSLRRIMNKGASSGKNGNISPYNQNRERIIFG